MSDGGISAGYGDHATGTTASHHEGQADTSALHAEAQAQGMTEDQARDVLNSMVDERLDHRFSSPDGLDRLYARMEEMSRQAHSQVANAGVPGAEDGYEDDYGTGYEYGDEDAGDGDVLDELDQVLSDAVDRRLDATEAAQEAETLVTERDAGFEELRDRLPMLQDGDAAQAIINRAIDLCEGWGREDMVGTPELVRVIEMVALASLSEPGLLAAPAPRQTPQTAQMPPGMYAGPQPGVQLESAAGAGGSNYRAQRSPSEQERFMAYVEATQSERV